MAHSRFLLISATFVLTGCALWNPFDVDTYQGRATGEVVIGEKVYRTEWEIEIRRSSSFNPYDRSGRGDIWRIDPNRATVTLSDGRQVWIDGNHSTPTPKDVLGTSTITARPTLTMPPLTAENPVSVNAPVFYIATDGSRDFVCHECKGSIRYTVNTGFEGPSEHGRISGYDDRPKPNPRQ